MSPEGDGPRFAIAAAKFNEFITSSLMRGAREGLTANGIEESRIDAVWVPGAFELPLTAKRLAQTGRYAAVICLGAVIRGDTPHFDYVSSGAAHGIVQAGLLTDVPIIFGVLTTDTVAQAMERSGDGPSNKGYDAALTAVEMAGLLKEL